MPKRTNFYAKSLKSKEKYECLTEKPEIKVIPKMNSFTKTDEDMNNSKDSNVENSDEQEIESEFEISFTKKKKIRFSDEVKVRFLLTEIESKSKFISENEKENMLWKEEERVDMIMHLAESICDDPQASKAWFKSSDLIQRVTGDDTPSMALESSDSSTSSGSIDDSPLNYMQRSGIFIQSFWSGVKSYLSLESFKKD